MYKIKEFIKWALTHVNPYTVPHDAMLARPWDECGTEWWQYLFGSVRVQTTQATLDYYYNHHYHEQMTRAQYDWCTRNWDRSGYATDCEGLLDAWLTYEAGEKMDINANMNYVSWCTEKGKISEINRDWVIGEALFRANSSGVMKHIGWICGFAADGEPLVVEAKSIAYGVLITKLSNGNWTHRGLMTAKFDYIEEEKDMIDFNIISPMPSGEAYLAMQKALNLSGYTDDDGRELEEDGKWGRRSRQAFIKMVNFNAPATEPAPEPVPSEPIPIVIEAKPRVSVEFGDYTMRWYLTEDLK